MSRKITITVTFLLSLLLLSALCGTARAAFSIVKLTDNETMDDKADINDSGQVVWEGYDGNDYEIFLYTPVRHRPAHR